MSGSVEPFFWGSIDSAVIVGRKSPDGFWGEDIGIDNVPSEVWDESHAGRDGRIVPAVFLALVFRIVEMTPAIGIGDGGQANKSGVEFPSFGGVLVVVR